MSRCINCGRELVTGDVYWDIELCDHCFLSVFADVTIDGKSINIICPPNVQSDEQIRQKNVKLKESIAKWENGEYVSSKTAKKAMSEIRADERRKVCDEIRHFFDKNRILIWDNIISADCLWVLLDKIEQKTEGGDD